MSAFNPSAQFPKRWLSTPIIAKQAFHQELDDIIALLKSDKPAKEFRFSHKDFNDDIAKLLHIYHTDTAKPITPADQTEQHALDEMVYKKLSNQLDDFLSEQMTQLSEDLKVWLRNAIKEELSNQQQP